MYRCKDPSLQMDEEDGQLDPTHASTENIPKCLNNTFSSSKTTSEEEGDRSRL